MTLRASRLASAPRRVREGSLLRNPIQQLARAGFCSGAVEHDATEPDGKCLTFDLERVLPMRIAPRRSAGRLSPHPSARPHIDRRGLCRPPSPRETAGHVSMDTAARTSPSGPGSTVAGSCSTRDPRRLSCISSHSGSIAAVEPSMRRPTRSDRRQESTCSDVRPVASTRSSSPSSVSRSAQRASPQEAMCTAISTSAAHPYAQAEAPPTAASDGRDSRRSCG